MAKVRVIQTLVFCSLVLATTASADGKTKPKTSLKPLPAPLLVDAFQGMTGTWDCKGKFKSPDGAGETDSQSTMVISAELDGFTYSGRYQVPKSDAAPNGMSGQMFWSYDSASNRLVEFFADSYGSIGRGTSEGLKDGVLVWNEDEVLMGQPKKVRTAVRHVSPTEIALSFDMDANGTWVNMGSNTCKKR
jgi:hypothetical protein